MSGQAFDAAAWERISPHFEQALDLDPQEREAWLLNLDTTQPEIAATLRSLLADHRALNAAHFLHQSPLAQNAELGPALRRILAEHPLSEVGTPGGDALPTMGLGRAAALGPGSTIGPYRLIRKIGEGGMSSVWLAERGDGQLKREVALKLPFLGPRMHIARFTHERDILAALTHPNIARLYDAGICESGQPYLAMEYVAGTGLIRYCDGQQLTIRERLRIFIQVLQAVQFAHTQLVIHRDLKPQNILVTPQGRVTLLDFGIGKLLTDATNELSLTQVAGGALTPHYASPEQIDGRPLGTASDIYSLGVILYELLTGARPHIPKHDSRAALEEAVLQGDLRRPSQRRIYPDAIALRRTTARALARSLAGDLDTIVLKALKAAPAERYVSAGAFAQDITNHLHNLPVSARPDSHWYRIGRFIARHELPVAAASVAVIALLVGSSMALWQARAAHVERDRAVALALRNAAVTEFLGRVITEAAESTEPVTVSELLARSEKLALTDAAGPAENRAAVLEIIADRYTQTDNMGRAVQIMERALELLDGSTDQALRSRLTCAHAAANADVGNIDAAVKMISNEVERLRSDPETASDCELHAARLLLHAHRASDAVRHAQHGLERLRDASAAAQPTAAGLLSALAFGHHLNGHSSQAEHYFSQAMQKFSELGRERTDDALTVMNDWAVISHNAGAPRRALELYARVMQIETERESGVEPTTTTVGNHARALQALGRFEQARAGYEWECRLAVRREDDFSNLHCVLGLALLTLEVGSLDEAAEHLRRSDELMDSSLPPDSPPMLVRAVLQGTLDLAHGRLAQARAQFEQVVKAQNNGSIGVDALLGKSATELAAGNFSQAADAARRALELATALQGGLEYSYRTGTAWLALGRALQRSGDSAEASTALDHAVEHLSNTVDPNHPALLEARQRLGDGVAQNAARGATHSAT